MCWCGAVSRRQTRFHRVFAGVKGGPDLRPCPQWGLRPASGFVLLFKHFLFKFCFRWVGISSVSAASQLARAWRLIRKKKLAFYVSLWFSTTCDWTIFLLSDSLIRDSHRCCCCILGIARRTEMTLMCSFFSHNKFSGSTQIMEIVNNDRCCQLLCG